MGACAKFHWGRLVEASGKKLIAPFVLSGMTSFLESEKHWCSHLRDSLIVTGMNVPDSEHLESNLIFKVSSCIMSRN